MNFKSIYFYYNNRKIDEIEEEKKKFHRHKCLESEEVQREMKELEIAKSKIKKEI